MKNANMPAFPVKGANNTPFTVGDSYEDYVQQCEPTVGLTKREYFAAMAMQGILSACPEHGPMSEMRVASYAIEYADELLKQLEK